MAILSVGDRAPRFTAVLSTGEGVSLGGEIQGYGAALLGVSFDGGESHDRFIARHRLPFPLVADTGRGLSRLYGAVRWEGPWPRAKRITYVIDREGIIRGVFHHELRIAKHVADVLSMLRGM